MSLVEHIKNKDFWLDTYEAMSRKSNFDEAQIQQLAYLNFTDFHVKALDLILEGNYVWSTPTKQQLNKLGTTRKRTVYVHELQDRYLLGVLYRVCSDYYKDKVSDACFSYKKGVRTLNAVDHLLKDDKIFKKHGVKLDISAYFNSVSRENLLLILHELLDNEAPCFLKLFIDLFMDDTVYYKGQTITEYKSLIPGCALSSFFANYCLKDLDILLSDTLGLTYARYSDDIIVFADTKEEVQKALDVIADRLNELGLRINPSKYEWYAPGDEITFLGLRFFSRDNKTIIDISRNSTLKMKKKIKYSTNYGRKMIETEHKDAYKMARKVFKRYNHRVFKCYVIDPDKYGWAYYAFRYINTSESIQEIDFYLKDRIRQMITGKNNKANISKVSNEKLEELGYTSLVQMYKLFMDDFDVYCDAVSLLP